MKKISGYLLLTIICACEGLQVFAQPNTSIDLKKPEKYENRRLGSEKTGEKKFSYQRRLWNNTVTHYNYWFNANNKLKEILSEAKATFKDDFTKLLPFYNYNSEVVAGSGEFDSIIYKCNAGILLHDLRSDWVDDMYLLMGEAYFYRKDYDSADQVFRFINYAFAPKESGGFDIPIGSNISGTNGTFTVSTKEKGNIVQKAFSTPPARNDALLWQAKNYLAIENYGAAAGLLQMLKSDPQFPSRLKPELEEALAYLYYQEHVYDSAASHLIQSLDNADNVSDKARREFLAGQLFVLAGNSSQATKYFEKSASHTKDAIMEVYANLGAIKADSSKSDAVLKEKLDNLIKMAHRDKYFDNRDIIYYAIAQVQLETKNYDAAQAALKKSVYYNTQENPQQRSRSFMMLADINYELGKYAEAKNFYDSVEASSLTDDEAKQRINSRQQGLGIIAEQAKIIHDEDSLQHLASLSKSDRDAAVRKMVRALRKQQGLTEEPEEDINVNPAVQQKPVELFKDAGSPSDWYFNNLALKTQGFQQFRAKWGNRPNADNWRRLAAIQAKKKEEEQQNADDSTDTEDENKTENNISVKLGDENDSDENAGEINFDNLYKNIPLSDEQMAASGKKIADALFTTGEAFQNKLEEYNPAIDNYELLLKKFPETDHKENALFDLYYCYGKTGRQSSADSSRAALVKEFPDGKTTEKLSGKPQTKTAADPATKKYEEVYNLFIEGKFEEAKKEKEKADSVYGSTFWTPQLLFIESIYYVSQRADTTAIEKLTQLANLDQQSPMGQKAVTMIDVLQRRAEIEDYLSKLEITRKQDDPLQIANLTSDETSVQKPDITVKNTASTGVKRDVKIVDTAQNTIVAGKVFSFNAADPQYAVIVLDKVDAVYATEARNAFNKYNASTFYSQRLTASSAKIDDRYNLVLIGPFSDAAAAVAYTDKIKPVASSRIVPWLKPDKYSFTIISETNLSLLKDNKDVDGYKAVVNKILPGKF